MITHEEQVSMLSLQKIPSAFAGLIRTQFPTRLAMDVRVDGLHLTCGWCLPMSVSSWWMRRPTSWRGVSIRAISCGITWGGKGQAEIRDHQGEGEAQTEIRDRQGEGQTELRDRQGEGEGQTDLWNRLGRGGSS